MLAFLAVVPLAVSLNTLIFEDGQLHFLTQNDVRPGDEVTVRGAPPSMLTLTRVIF